MPRFFIVGLLFSTLFPLGGCSNMSRLSDQDLKIEAGSIRSLAASGALLAEQSGQGKTTETFTHTQIKLIEDKTKDSVNRLENSTADSEAMLTRESAVANRLKDALGRGAA